MFDYLLFDLDGTLTDSFDGIINCVLYALEQMGERSVPRDSLGYFIGPPLIDSFTVLFDGDTKKAERGVALYRERYEPIGWTENKIYDGVEEMLSALKAEGKTLAVATSKPERFSTRIVSHFGLDKYFAHHFGATMDSSRSTKDKVVKYALDTLACDKTRVVMIGDRRYDVEGAKVNGIKSIGVLYGYGNEQELTAAGADFIAATPKDIINIINKR